VLGLRCPIGIQILLALILAGVILGLSTWLGTPKRSRTDLSPYECGSELIDPSDKRFTVRFYMVAMLFILFDIEAAFLFLWVQSLRELGAAAFWAMTVFKDSDDGKLSAPNAFNF